MLSKQLKTINTRGTKKKDFVSQHSKKSLNRLKDYNHELYELLELIEMDKQGKKIERRVPNPLIPNRYVRALLTIKDSKYPTWSSEVAKKCDISSYEVRQLNYYELTKVDSKDYKNRYRYVISKFGLILLNHLGLHKMPSILKEVYGLKPKKRVQKILGRYREVLKEKMPERVFKELWFIYNSPVTKLTPGRINDDMRTIEMYLNGSE